MRKLNRFKNMQNRELESTYTDKIKQINAFIGHRIGLLILNYYLHNNMTMK